MPLLDKVGGKLSGWKGKLMSKAARVQLVKSVLTFIVTYHTTIFPLPKWLIKKIDKMRINFLLESRGRRRKQGGICLVKWDIVCRPKELGGLGIHDLIRFRRALRQMWCWYQWTNDERPWHVRAIPCDEEDHALFQASNVLVRQVVGWSGTHKHCTDPIQETHFKRISVAKELSNKNWMRLASHISTHQELIESSSLLNYGAF
jgi:hypothetical protein